MLTRRVIPCLDINGGRVVKGVQFQSLRDAGDPVTCAALYESQGADEIVVLDVSATLEARKTARQMVSAIRGVLSIPLTVGGGVRSLDDVWQLLEFGADKVAINTAASENPDLINQVAERFGRQCTVVAIDNQQGSVFTHAGSRNTNRKTTEWTKEVAERGAGEILLTSIDCDGKQAGFNTQLLAQVRKAVSIPIIASGGAGCLKHFSDAIQSGADAVLAASLFHDQVLSIQEVKSYFRSQNIEVRS